MTTLTLLLIIVLLPMTIVIMMTLAPYAIGMLIAVSILVSVIMYFEWVLMGVLIGAVGWLFWMGSERVFNSNMSILNILTKTIVVILVVSVFLMIMVV
jgi:hypothetical protein